LLGVRVDPPKVLQNFLGVNYPLVGGGSNPLDPPVKYSPAYAYIGLF